MSGRNKAAESAGGYRKASYVRGRSTHELKLLIFELRNLPEEVRRRFQSDMRIVVDYLAEGKDYRSEQKEYLPAIAIVNTSVTGSFRSYL